MQFEGLGLGHGVVVCGGTILWMAVAIWPHFRWVAVAQVPYLIWVSIAMVLQLTITVRNG